MNFLDYKAQLGSAFLHPGGAYATDILMSESGLSNNQTILEIGCGTGASIIHITKKFNTKSVAVDCSSTMLEVAKERADFFGMKHNIQFTLIGSDGMLPFEDHSFDFVYAESVLAILNESSLNKLLSEINRVLKPNARFISNDAIWKDETARIRMEQINQACLNDFGLIQSLSSPAYKNEWTQVFSNSNFKVVKTILLDQSKNNTSSIKHKLFGFTKKLRTILKPSLLNNRAFFNSQLKHKHAEDGLYLKNYMFVLQKK